MRTALSPVAGLARPAMRPKPGTRAITLSLPTDMISQFKQYAHRERITHASLLMDAVRDTHEAMPKPLLRPDATLRSDGMFLRRVPGDGESKGTLALRLLASNVEAIDALVAEHQAPSRSMYCQVALRCYLLYPPLRPS